MQNCWRTRASLPNSTNHMKDKRRIKHDFSMIISSSLTFLKNYWRICADEDITWKKMKFKSVKNIERTKEKWSSPSQLWVFCDGWSKINWTEYKILIRKSYWRRYCRRQSKEKDEIQIRQKHWTNPHQKRIKPSPVPFPRVFPATYSFAMKTHRSSLWAAPIRWRGWTGQTRFSGWPSRNDVWNDVLERLSALGDSSLRLL